MTGPGAQNAASATPSGRRRGYRMARRVSAPATNAGLRMAAPVRIPGLGLPAGLGLRRLGLGFGAAAITLVAGVGVFGSHVSGGGAEPAPAASTSAGSAVSTSWGSSSVAQIDVFDLAWKGLLVLVLLYVTLRVLARVQGAGQPRRGNLNVLESKQLAAKASLHLVAVGERRLVVGLTPAGMVSLAELDADELPAEEPATRQDATPDASRTPLGGILRPALAPVDTFAARLAATIRREQRGRTPERS